jgi:cytoskeletal protein CcmA (bactofilin family)
MKSLLLLVLAGALALTASSAGAQDAKLEFGGDLYAAGQNAATQSPVQRDAFIAGNDVTLNAPVSGDAHLAGFDVNANAPISGDIYAFGFSVDVTGEVGGDVTAAGNNVTLRSTSAVAGNARLAGQNVTIATPIEGSVLISAQTLTLDAPITGDLNFFGENIAFAPGARVDGKVSIQAPKEIAVPVSVAAADRVSFVQFAPPDYMSEAGRSAAETVVTRFWPGVWFALSGWLVLVIIGAALIALIPRGVARMQVVSEARPFRKLGLGILAFASLLGLVPVFALTLVGIIALPVVFVVVGIGCLLGYLAGVYFAGLRVSNAFTRVDTNLKRIVLLAVALPAAGLVGMIPVLGWLVTLTLLVFGLGVIAAVLMVRWSSNDAERLQPLSPASAATPAE